MKKHIIVSASLLILLFSSCKKEIGYEETDVLRRDLPGSKTENNSGHVKIVALSDIHYMHPSLLQNNAANGTAFKSILATEPYKVLLPESPAILDEVLAQIKIERPDIVLVAGDMAKDGEKISHEAVADYFNQLEATGIKVYVVAGNNDINNPSSLGYNGNSSYPVPNVNPGQFKSIYWNFGFGEAISSDPNSLSYVAEATPNLWIMSIDAAMYSPTYRRSGTIKAETRLWIKQQLLLAKENNITVLGLKHHNTIEHFSGQSQITPNTIIEDISASSSADNYNWQPVADSLMSWGLNVVFTGHSHAHDISVRMNGDNVLYDVATGSLITPPSPYRIMTLKNKIINISTNEVTSISSELPGGVSFVDYSRQALSSSFDNFFRVYFSRPSFGLIEPALSTAIPLGRNAYMAFIAGDEKLSPIEEFRINYLQKQIDSLNSTLSVPIPSLTIDAINTLWTDPGIKDKRWQFKVQ